MTPWTIFLGLLLAAQGCALSVVTMSGPGRPVMDARNDVALQYVSAWTLCILTIFREIIGSHAFCST